MVGEVCKVKVKWSCYRSGVGQRVGRGIALLFHDRGTGKGWVVSSTPQLHFTAGKDPVPQGWSGRAENLVPTRKVKCVCVCVCVCVYIYIYIYILPFCSKERQQLPQLQQLKSTDCSEYRKNYSPIRLPQNLPTEHDIYKHPIYPST